VRLLHQIKMLQEILIMQKIIQQLQI